VKSLQPIRQPYNFLANPLSNSHADFFSMGDAYLPALVMFNIMSLFSVEELCVISMVSTNWYDSVHHKDFTEYYNKICILNPKRLLLTLDCARLLGPCRMLITISKKGIMSEKWHSLFNKFGFQNYNNIQIIGSIDGVLCIQHAKKTPDMSFIIGNPVTARFINVKNAFGIGDLGKFTKTINND